MLAMAFSCMLWATPIGPPTVLTFVIGDSTITVPTTPVGWDRVKFEAVWTPEGTHIKVSVNKMTIEAPRITAFIDQEKLTLTANSNGGFDIAHEQLP